MPVNAARHARQLKQIKKVQDAIRYRDSVLERLQPVKEKRRETKEYFLTRERINALVTNNNIRAARNNAREDWDLGPLRPNRAIGEDAETLGIYQREGLRDVPIPKHWVGSGDEVQKKVKARLPEHVLRDQWPIVEGDRVVVIRGQSKNKIGVVQELLKENNMVLVKDVNKIWVDSTWSKVDSGETTGRRKEVEKPLSYDDVRLVAAWEDADGNRKDVIIDKVLMKPHSTGIDPFTDRDPAKGPETDENDEEIHMTEIPEEHRFDPNTGEALYHRYVEYGTRSQRIPWPWELPDKSENKSKDTASSKHDPVEEPKSLTTRFYSKVRSLNPFAKKEEPPKPAPEIEYQEPEKAADEGSLEAPIRPREPDAWDHADDTSTGAVELKLGDIDNNAHFLPTLTFPPFPESVREELRDMDLDEDFQSLDSDTWVQQEQLEAEKAARIEAPVPKTPRQVARELHLARKAAERPAVVPEPLEEGASSAEWKSMHQQFGLNLAEDFARRVQREMGGRVRVVRKEKEVQSKDAEVSHLIPEVPEEVSEKRV
ncbi:hypothetical protein K491DRAFT_781043 [Lophiostoma macrostomum CBS 122681]|uniref:KOW domain-containing protein n=1 Tax=Lophiostoma macrostomum CBS 122681 TaxID=1314788 RepID=A0A6A6T1R3_9PLEO|nr:hypothetical protein K491DRAFT_781043 [Lophiostoma macrostomum CBS 122681]